MLPNGLSIDSNSLQLGLYTGDTLQNQTLYLGFDTNSLPHYLQEISMFIQVDSNVTQSVVSIYFTPWDTIEVWSEESVNALDRNWIIPNSLTGRSVRYDQN